MNIPTNGTSDLASIERQLMQCSYPGCDRPAVNLCSHCATGQWCENPAHGAGHKPLYPTTDTGKLIDPKPTSGYSDALSRIHNTGQAPDDDSGLRSLCMVAQAAEDAYSEAEYQFDNAEDGTPVKAILRIAYQQAYDLWQNIERAGLPLLHQYQRETLGYSEDELTPATDR